MEYLYQEDYNDRQFLVPDSVKSCASYHAKVVNYQNETKLMFRLNDCNKGALIINDANSAEERKEMITKLRSIAKGASDFDDFLESK